MLFSLIKRPIQDRFLDFGLINLTLAYIGRWTPGRSQYAANPGYTASLMYFLGVFAGQWPSRNERSWFSCQHDLLPVGDGFYRYCPQVHLRCFESITALEKSLGASGLRCDRERGQILSDNAGGGLHFFEERRISVFGLVSSHGPLTSRRLPAFYSVLILADLQFKPEKNWDYEWCAGLEGTIAFHAAIFESVVFWQAKWNDVLDNVDDRLRVRLEHTMDPEEIKRWMFDDGFERSKLYVTILQILRIFSECISTTSDDLGLLDGLFMKDNDFPMRNMRPDELRKMRSNWQSVKEFQKQAEESLLGRIMQKTEEVKSLRDGLFNATSLREANLSSRLAEQSSRQTEQSLIEAQRSALMGRYVLVFTVVTILYLPPSFISTVLDMDIFKKDIGQGRWEYKVSVVSVSLLTYLLAFVTIIAADWKGFKRRFSAWWTRLTDKWECFKLFLTVILVAIIPDYWDRIEGMRLQWWNTTSDGGRISDDSRISDESSKSDEIVSKGRIASEGNSPGASSGAAACTQAGHALVDPEPDPKEARSADWKKDLERGS
ncbi:hypothetical protein F4859DRAFT_1999 [Xylaria cf. heliscus]|nr:hypothetical protein F4859DRAFT_1999 [Xylaria cf. heliscus]